MARSKNIMLALSWMLLGAACGSDEEAAECPSGQHPGGEGCVAISECSPGWTHHPDDSCARWQPAPSLLQDRYAHTATLLPDGRVLVTGGYGDGTVELRSAEIFDPAANAWVAADEMAEPRARHSATLLADGRVLVTGGLGATDAYVPAEVFDPGTGHWTAIPPVSLELFELANHRSVLLDSGDVLVTGGGPYAFLLTIGDGQWQRLEDLHASRRHHAAIRLADGRVLLAGGDSMTGPAAATTAEIYDPGSRTFEPVGDMTISRDFCSAIEVDAGLFVVGQSGADRFDPSTASFAPAGSFSLSLRGTEVTAIAGGTLPLIVGGVGANPSSATEWFDPATSTWVRSAPLAAPRMEHALVTLGDGRVLAIGGFSGENLTDTEVYATTR